MEKGSLSPCPKTLQCITLELLQFGGEDELWSHCPDSQVTALTLRLGKSKISGQTHQAASEIQLEAVEQQPICKRAVMVIPKYLVEWNVCGQSEAAQRAAGFESLVIKGQWSTKSTGTDLNQLYCTAVFCGHWIGLKMDVFNFFSCCQQGQNQQDRSLQMNPTTPSPLVQGHVRMGDFGLFHP